MRVVRSSGHDPMMPRHFLGRDDEIAWATRGIPTRDLPAVKTLTDLNAVQFYIKFYPAVVMSVVEIRLFDANNHEAVRFRFPRRSYFSKEEEEKQIRRASAQRLKVILTITSGTSESSELTTVSFIPGDVDHVEYGMRVLEECWQKELSLFCATLHQNPQLHFVHIASKLCESALWQLNVNQLLDSSLVELSLPDLKVPQGWYDLAMGLARNRDLRLLTLEWNADGIETFLQTRMYQFSPDSSSGEVNWTECNSTLETLWISCPRELDLQADAEPVASVLHRVPGVKYFIFECARPESAPILLTQFASCLRQALLAAPNVVVLHLLIPFSGQELTEHILPIRSLTGLVLMSDRWMRPDLEAVGAMVRANQALRFFGVRHQNPKRKVSLWKCLQRITEADMVEFLSRVGQSNLQTLSLQRWGLVDGKKVLAAVMQLHRNRPHLEVDLTGTGLALKDMLEPVVSLLQKLEKAEVSRDRALSNRSNIAGSPASLHSDRVPNDHLNISGSPSSLHRSLSASQAGRHGSVYMSAMSGATSTSGSSMFAKGSTISEHGEFNSQFGSEPGTTTIWTSSSLEQQQGGQLLQARASTPMFFSSFSYDEVEEATKKFQTVLGEGGFGKVYEGELGDSGKKVAVKVLKVDTSTTGGDQQRVEMWFVAQVQTLALIHHVNLVRLLGYCTQNGRHMLIYEFMPNSSLDRWIFRDETQSAKLDWEQRKIIAVGVARGLEYLHFGCAPPIIHSGVKAENILLDAEFKPKLADIGPTRLVDMQENLATPYYVAPEIQLQGIVTAKCDVFSFGLLLMELITGKKNTNEDSRRFFPAWARSKFGNGLYRDVYHELRAPLLSPIIPGYQAEEARKMMCIAIACIHEDMDMRPDMKTVLLMLEGRMEVPEPSGNRNSARYDYRHY